MKEKIKNNLIALISGTISLNSFIIGYMLIVLCDFPKEIGYLFLGSFLLAISFPLAITFMEYLDKKEKKA